MSSPVTAFAAAPAGRRVAWSVAAALLVCAALIWHVPAAREVLTFLLPWEFSPTVLIVTVAALLAYANGQRKARGTGRPASVWRPAAFYVSVTLLYFALQSRLDYYAQHMFYMHRLQHLVLHHVGPFLLALSAPQRLLALGVPEFLRIPAAARLLKGRALRTVLYWALHPVLAPVLFIVGIGIWLIPTMHFYVMLSLPLYKLMNWSMLADGLPFWWLVLDPRPAPPARMRFGVRVLMLWAVMIPQILMGSVISLSHHDLYPVYKLCGRIFALSPQADQQIGGLIIWIPGAMMSVLAALIVLSYYRRQQRLGPAAATI